MKKILYSFCMLCCLALNAQQTNTNAQDAWKKNYRSFSTKVNDLKHVKLKANFDIPNAHLLGKVWLTLQPHFYATDSLRLDAKGMDIHAVEIIKIGKSIPLSYTYDSLTLNIKLDKSYLNNEQYTVYIDYTSKPNETKFGGSAAINDAKGLYFINPKGLDSLKPTQIWTQGETESNSVWLPLIDKPNQKTTSEMYLTVPSKFVTLSNGLLVDQINNANKTRTDHWKMDLPHAPYLISLVVGDYAIVKDTYKGKEVSYYVEKDYEKVARKIFGNTPEMIAYYSKILGIDYPWQKYSQVTARDYVSGAMENTTATLHQESAQQNARQLVDENKWETTIAHELFHHWFGDLVTAESWSNLTVNESFANYSEVIWTEHKYGKDAGEEQNDNDLNSYLRSYSSQKNLVRYYYFDKEDMFDRVSYQKGGRILHMLRNYVGDSAFFKSLHLYLVNNKFGSGNAHKLRLAFEEVTGKDLNWFFNQWYFGSGHPKLNIKYSYDSTTHKAMVQVKQNQLEDKLFKLPVSIDIYFGANKKRYQVIVENKVDSFVFDAPNQPSLINFDADHVLLAEKKENKSLEEYIHQYKYASTFIDRRDALNFAIERLKKPSAFNLVVDALKDPYYTLRLKAIGNLYDTILSDKALATIENMAQNDPNRIVRANAIDYLGKLGNPKYYKLFLKNTFDSSYSVAGSSLEALSDLDEAKAISLLPQLRKDMKGSLKEAVEKVSILTKTDADFKEMSNEFENAGFYDKFKKIEGFISFMGKVNDTSNFKKGIDLITTFRDQVSPYAPNIKETMNKLIKRIITKKEILKKSQDPAIMDQEINYIKERTMN